MRKITAVTFSLIVIFSSGIAVAQEGPTTYDPSTEGATEHNASVTYSYTHSRDGNNPAANDSIQDERVLDLDKRGDRAAWLAYEQDATDTSGYFVGKGMNLNTGETISQNTDTIEELSDIMVSKNLGTGMMNATGSGLTYADYHLLFATGLDGTALSSGAELYDTAYQEGTTDYRTFSSDSVQTMDRLMFNGNETIIYTTESGTTNMYNVETGEDTELYTWAISTNMEAYQLTEDTLYINQNNITQQDGTTHDQYGQVHNVSSGTTSDVWGYSYYLEGGYSNENNLLGVNETHIAINAENGVAIYTKEWFAEHTLNTTGQFYYDGSEANATIMYPDNVSSFQQGGVVNGNWAFVDETSQKMYVYNGFDNVKAIVSNVYNPMDGEQNGYVFYGSNGGDGKETLRYGTYDDNHIEFRNTQVVLEETQEGCAAYLNPQQFEGFWEAPNVCWIPIYIGTGILGTLYQFIILGIIVAMPIAKMTDSDIATMATIDGVLLIGMLIGGLAPGFVAIALLTTVLLASYGRANANVTINQGGGEEL